MLPVRFLSLDSLLPFRLANCGDELVEHVQRASLARWSKRADVCVDHGRFESRVAQQLLDGANINPRIQQMRREGMPETVTRASLEDLGFIHCERQSAAECRIVDVPATFAICL